VESPEEVCHCVPGAAELIPVESLRTTDGCGFSQVADDALTSREVTFARIKTRVEGTATASAELGDSTDFTLFREDTSMAHIQLPEGLPGIVGPLTFSPDTAKPLLDLAEVLLRGPNTLSSADREMIATYVSSCNDCCFCQLSHGAAAAEHLGGDYDLIDRVKLDFETAAISSKLKALLAIAGKVQRGGKQVSDEDVARAREQGATDREIHDTVLIAAAFCMYNRYVDGLATMQPSDPQAYREMGQRLANEGYLSGSRRRSTDAA
jgi:uncharacterized peroxidase-related enzyme